MAAWQDKFRMILSVYLVLQRKDGQVLLLLRENTGYKDGEYGLPAGHVDGGETALQAMVREAKEETGIDVQEEDLELRHTMHRNCGDHERVDYFFWCTQWQGEPKNVEPNKCGGLFWYPISALPEKTIDYYQVMFAAVAQGKLLSTFGWK